MKIPVVVLDTNLFVAAFWNPHSASAWIISGCESGSFKLVYTAAIKRELDRILRQAKASPTYRERIMRLIVNSEMVEPRLAPVRSDDSDDQKFLECAVAVEADYIITSDEHLLKLRHVDATEIVTPSRFRRNIEDQSEE